MYYIIYEALQINLNEPVYCTKTSYNLEVIGGLDCTLDRFVRFNF